MKFEYQLVSGKLAPVLCFSLEQSLDYDQLIEGLCSYHSISLIENKLVHSCFGPVETIHEVETSAGIFNIFWAGEGIEEGYEIYSDNVKLIDMILEFTRSDERFFEFSRHA